VLRSGLPEGRRRLQRLARVATWLEKKKEKEALTSTAESILAGPTYWPWSGGADSMSDVPLGDSRRLAAALLEAS